MTLRLFCGARSDVKVGVVAMFRLVRAEANRSPKRNVATLVSCEDAHPETVTGAVMSAVLLAFRIVAANASRTTATIWLPPVTWIGAEEVIATEAAIVGAALFKPGDPM